jgi:hypothetical protein
MVTIGRHIEGISLNGIEYLLNEDGSVMRFASIPLAKEYLRSKMGEDVTDELLEEVFIFEEDNDKQLVIETIRQHNFDGETIESILSAVNDEGHLGRDKRFDCREDGN